MTLSLKEIVADKLSVSPPFSVLSDVFGFSSVPSGAEYSLRDELNALKSSYRYIQLRVRKVKCEEETFGLGPDDIHIGGVVAYPDFRTKVFRKNFGAFNEGEQIPFTKKLFGLDLRSGKNDTDYPVRIVVNLSGLPPRPDPVPAEQVGFYDTLDGYRGDIVLEGEAKGLFHIPRPDLDAPIIILRHYLIML